MHLTKPKLFSIITTTVLCFANLLCADSTIPVGPGITPTGITGNTDYDNGKISELLFTQFGIPSEDKALTADGLLNKGLTILGQVQQKTRMIDTGKINYNSVDVHRALDYIIPAALSGHLTAGPIAIDLLQGYSMYPNKHDWVFKIAKILHEKHSIKGTYHLAIAYKNGLAITPNYELAKVLFGQVAAVCKTNREGTCAILGGGVTCSIATSNYENLKSIGKQDFDTTAGANAYKSALQQKQLSQIIQQQMNDSTERAKLIKTLPATGLTPIAQ